MLYRIKATVYLPDDHGKSDQQVKLRATEALAHFCEAVHPDAEVKSMRVKWVAPPDAPTELPQKEDDDD